MKRHSGERKARALIALASSSVGSKQATHAYKLHLKQLLDEYDLAALQLKTVETEIIAVLERIPFAKSMLAVKGISAISLAGILGEAGDLSGFVHGNALLRRTLHHYYTRTKKMKKVHSIIKLCGKLARILVGIVRQEQTYIPEKVVTATTAA